MTRELKRSLLVILILALVVGGSMGGGIYLCNKLDPGPPPAAIKDATELGKAIDELAASRMQEARDLNTCLQDKSQLLQESIELHQQIMKVLKDLEEANKLAGMCMCKDLCWENHGLFDNRPCPPGCDKYLKEYQEQTHPQK